MPGGVGEFFARFARKARTTRMPPKVSFTRPSMFERSSRIERYTGLTRRIQNMLDKASGGIAMSATTASRQLSSKSTPTVSNDFDQRHARRDDAHLHEAAGAVDVAGKSRRDPARLHVRKLAQRQADQAPKQALAQSEDQRGVEEIRAVAPPGIQNLLEDQNRDETQPREVKLVKAFITPRPLIKSRSMMYLIASGQIRSRTLVARPSNSSQPRSSETV